MHADVCMSYIFLDVLFSAIFSPTIVLAYPKVCSYIHLNVLINIGCEMVAIYGCNTKQHLITSTFKWMRQLASALYL